MDNHALRSSTPGFSWARMGCVLAALLFCQSCSRNSPGASAAGKSAPVDIVALRAKAEAGDGDAQAALGSLYAKGESVSNSYAEAANWYRKAAAQGNAEAELSLGELYQAGQGVGKDVAQAIEWYRKAAAQGHPRAQYTLGFMYEAGRGVRQDQTAAAKWFRSAAEQGDAVSQYDLGQRYDLGVGVPVNKVEALKWLMLAANQGQPDSVTRRDQVRKSLTRDQVAEAKRRVSAFVPAHAALK